MEKEKKGRKNRNLNVFRIRPWYRGALSPTKFEKNFVNCFGNQTLTETRLRNN